MTTTRYRVQFPPIESQELGQDEVFFYLTEGDDKVKFRFHDYSEIYKRPGLYEQVFYDRLKCNSPAKVSEILQQAVRASDRLFSQMRVLDLGAGNGMMGEELKHVGVARMIGADIIPEAMEATYRDRPGVYDEYYVEDFTNLSDKNKEDLSDWGINCFTTVAALGFGDIPPKAFYQGLSFVQNGGFVAFNIKKTFLDHSDQTGFSRLIRELIFSEYLTLHHLELYRHRLSMDGQPLYYYAVVAEKTADMPHDFIDRHHIDE